MSLPPEPPPESASYSEGERVFGPPPGSYDADWVAASARDADPGLPPETALLLARAAWARMRDAEVTDPAELARRLFADNPDVGASAANVVAVAAVQFCAVYDVDPRG